MLSPWLPGHEAHHNPPINGGDQQSAIYRTSITMANTKPGHYADPTPRRAGNVERPDQGSRRSHFGPTPMGMARDPRIHRQTGRGVREKRCDIHPPPRARDGLQMAPGRRQSTRFRKYHARHNHQGGEGFYFISKRDRFDPNLRTPETARPIHGDPHPEQIWHRQKPWKDNFPLPEDMWSDPKTNEDRIPHQSVNDIRRGMAGQLIKRLSKGPGETLETLAVLHALNSPADRGR